MSVELMSVAPSYVPKWPKSPDFIIINPPKTQQKLNNDNVLEYELGTIIVNFGVYVENLAILAMMGDILSQNFWHENTQRKHFLPHSSYWSICF